MDYEDEFKTDEDYDEDELNKPMRGFGGREEVEDEL